MSIQTTLDRPVLNDSIELTQKAAAEVARLKAANNIPAEHGLRLSVKGGGCSGLSYVLGFDVRSGDNDKVFDSLGVTVYVDQKSLFYLAGTVLDFSDGLNGKGFVFDNPQAARSCGCGSSFGV